MTTRMYGSAVKKRRVLRLSKEAFDIVDQNANEIAKYLLANLKKGGIMSGRLLVELAEKDVDIEEGKTVGPLRSLALMLANAPQSRPPGSTPLVPPELLGRNQSPSGSSELSVG